MNLFCFSLEGSTDSLYEAPQKSPDPTSWSPEWSGLEPCIAPELLQSPTRQRKTDLKKAKRKSDQSTSEITRISDKTASSNVYCPCTGKRDDLVHHQAEGASKDPYKTSPLAQEERTKRDQRDDDVQVGEDKAYGTLQKIHKLVKSSVEESRNPPDVNGLSKKPEKKLGNDPNQHSEPGNEKKITEIEDLWAFPEHFHHHWSSTDMTCSYWESSYHTCHRPTAEPWLYNVNFTLPRGTDRHRYEELIYDLDVLRMEYPPLRVIHSFTDLDMTNTMTNNTSLRVMLQRRASNASEKPRNKPKRSYSFGRFDKHQSKPEEHESTLAQGADGESAEGDHIKGGLGKKMKAISMTMRKKMGKKYARALSEETGESVDGDQEAEGVANACDTPAKDCTTSSNSVESLFSLHSGQSSSSSGITSGSEGSCNRDSLRLEEEVPDTIQFCGKAKVHTDFIPSPYDTESLKLKVGDMIDIISKPPMGIWTGMLNGKVGSFKFIYVDVLAQEPAPVHRMGNHRRSRRPRPKTLQEFLERLNLEEFMSSLLLNGYQTVEDLKDLKEQHLIELNVTDPEHRHKLLAATECLHDVASNSQREGEGEEAPKSPSATVKAELSDCPRDSGCYIASDCSDNSKEDAESHLSAAPSPSLAEV